MSMLTTPAEGMRDLLPAEVQIRNSTMSKILSVYNRFGFLQIETPCADRIELFTGGEGGENEKMLFKILKRGDKLPQAKDDLADLGLRYDLTVPLCRFFAANRATLPNPFKSIQIGNVWRAERPQKGRYRQFVQCDIDIIGQSGVIAEIELISATAEALMALGFEGFEVKINDRRLLEAIAQYAGFEQKDFAQLFITFDKLDKIGLNAMVKQLLEGGFDPVCCQKIGEIAQKSEQIKTIEQMRSFLTNLELDFAILDDLDSIIQATKSSRYQVHLDISLVRGMGYYTGTIFEIKAPNYASSIAGGGRYDKMIGKFLQTQEQIPACGFSIGFERVVQILSQKGIRAEKMPQKIAVIFPKHLQNFMGLTRLAKKLRKGKTIVSLELERKNKAAHLEQLATMGFTHFCLYDQGSQTLSAMKSLTKPSIKIVE